MSANRYESWATTCFIVAVVSSLLYGKLGSFDWLALLLGVSAGIGAAVTYFYNAASEGVAEQEALEETQLAVQEQPAAQPANREPAAPEWPRREKADYHYLRTAILKEVNLSQASLWDNNEEIDHVTPRGPIVRILRYHSTPNVAVHFRKHSNEASLRRVQLLRERQLFLDEVQELVRRLGGTCDFELSLGGSLTIRPVRTGKEAEQELKHQGSRTFSLDAPPADERPERVN